MDAVEPELDMEGLIEAIWGPKPVEITTPAAPTLREEQNKALAAALTAYLNQYLADNECT